MRDGFYGTSAHRRQRWKCVPAGARAHLIAVELPRQAAASGCCASCERAWRPGEGHRTPRHFTYPTRQIASALVAVGAGAPYAEAARRARRAAGRVAVDEPTGSSSVSGDAAMVARWVSSFGPVVAAPHSPASWPNVVLLDHLAFHTGDLRPDGTKKPSGRLLFSVLAAGGYTSQGEFVLLGLRTANGWAAEDWERFLEDLGLQGSPRRVVLDAAGGQRAGAERIWGTEASGGPRLWFCHHHLTEALVRALAKDGHRSATDPLVLAARKALGGRAGWRAFRAAAATESLPAVEKWITSNEAIVERQVARQRGHVSIGALEAALRRVKNGIFDRRYGFKNRARTEALLELMRLKQNGLDDEIAYAGAIEAHLREHAGRPALPLIASSDPHNHSSLPSARTGTSGRPRRRLRMLANL